MTNLLLRHVPNNEMNYFSLSHRLIDDSLLVANVTTIYSVKQSRGKLAYYYSGHAGHYLAGVGWQKIGHKSRHVKVH